MSIDRIPLPRTAGALWLCGRADVGPDPEAALACAGAGTVVCLNHVRELETRFAPYVEWLRANMPGRALWFPIRNFDAESAAATMPVLQMIVDRLEAGEGVVMHCALGQGRAGTMAVCLLMMLGATRDEALRTVAVNRLYAGPAQPSQWALVDEVAAVVGAS
ncbi:MAG TPA: tyrosine-protein phosphatase [Ilumatobacter sp.]